MQSQPAPFLPSIFLPPCLGGRSRISPRRFSKTLCLPNSESCVGPAGRGQSADCNVGWQQALDAALKNRQALADAESAPRRRMEGRHRPEAADHGRCAPSMDRDDIDDGASRRRARLSLATDLAISGLTPDAAPQPRSQTNLKKDSAAGTRIELGEYALFFQVDEIVARRGFIERPRITAGATRTSGHT